jgi:hypothetical protein
MPSSSLLALAVAALGGGFITGLIALGTKRAEFAREDGGRWIEQRRAAYLGFLRAQRTLEFRGVQRQLASPNAPDTFWETADLEIRQARKDASDHLDELQFIAPRVVLEAANGLDLAVKTLVTTVEMLGVKGEKPTGAVMGPLMLAVDETAAQFRRQARRDLRVRGRLPLSVRLSGQLRRLQRDQADF